MSIGSNEQHQAKQRSHSIDESSARFSVQFYFSLNVFGSNFWVFLERIASGQEFSELQCIATNFIFN